MSHKKVVEEDFNPAAKLLEDILKAWKSNSSVFVIATVVIIVALVAFYSYDYLRTQKMAVASSAYGEVSLNYGSDKSKSEAGLKKIVEEYAGTPYSTYSAYLIAQNSLSDKKYDEAITWFDKAISSSSKKTFIVAESYEGRGVALEAKGDNSSAISSYEKVISIKEGLHRKSAVEYKLALLLNKTGDKDGALAYCDSIANDSLASDPVKLSAKNLKVTISVAN